MAEKNKAVTEPVKGYRTLSEAQKETAAAAAICEAMINNEVKLTSVMEVSIKLRRVSAYLNALETIL